MASQQAGDWAGRGDKSFVFFSRVREVLQDNFKLDVLHCRLVNREPRDSVDTAG